MNPKNISQEDLALFALQLLSPEESAEVVTHLEHNETSRAELAQIQGDLSLYALSSELHSPPAMARERLLRRVAKEKKLVPIAMTQSAAVTGGNANADLPAQEPLLMPRGGRVSSFDQERAPRRANPFLAIIGWGGWAVAAALGAMAGFQYHQRQLLQDSVNTETAKLQQVNTDAAKAESVLQTLTDAGAMQIALHQPETTTPVEAAKPEAHAAYVADTGALVFVASHLAPLQAYKTYELWVIPEDGRDPVPAGTFKPDARGYANVVMPEMPKGIAAKTFGVTVEEDGGSKTGPTKPIVLVGM